MRPTLSQLESFYWIARLGTFRAAAAQLNLTQPTISLRIRGLEQAVGVALFERAGRRLRLTAEAAQLLPQVERMIGLAAELSSRPGGADPLRGRLRLGAPDSFGLICLPELLASLKLQYPELHIAVTIDNSAVLGRRLIDRDLDVAVLVDPAPAAHVRSAPLGTMTLAWVAAPGLGLPRRIVRPEHLLQQEIFTNPEPSNLLPLIRRWFASAGLRPTRLSTCNSLSVILTLTMAGAGVSLLPVSILATQPGAGALAVLRARPAIPTSRMHVAHLIDKAGPGLQVVLQAIRAVVARSSLLAPG
jgi:DNA-binding transcriptional LysR family regulator